MRKHPSHFALLAVPAIVAVTVPAAALLTGGAAGAEPSPAGAAASPAAASASYPPVPSPSAPAATSPRRVSTAQADAAVNGRGLMGQDWGRPTTRGALTAFDASSAVVLLQQLRCR
ncbi:MAG TPA: hypothetical protein VMH50_08810 [Thermoleophilia bacterium]|nr:hypothetical protein [Thermoleophilia bacterium]